jgi:hypothetical protein
VLVINPLVGQRRGPGREEAPDSNSYTVTAIPDLPIPVGIADSRNLDESILTTRARTGDF